ncbi:hypothetical protein V2A60_002018 [Cordyceps javanica]
MDPSSVIRVIGVIAQVTQAIYVYGDAVKECKTEVAQLRCELFGMQAALKQMEQDLKLVQQNSSLHSVHSPSLYSPQCQEMLSETHQVLLQLANSLQVGSAKHESITRRLVWPLKRPQVKSLATHLERLKTFFILAVTQDSLQATQDIQYSLDALSESVQEIRQTHEEQTVYLDAMNWLGPCDPNVAHTTASACRLVGTNSWFLEEAFQDWVSETVPVLWLKGKPGSGKTCLMSACADRLLQSGCSVAYFYCSYNDSLSQEPRSILGSLITQLCRQHASVRSVVLAAYQESKSRNSLHNMLQVPMLISLIRKVMPALSKDVFFFVDAADECGDNLVMALDALFQLVTGHDQHIRLMLSSTENVAQTIIDSISLHGVLTMQKIQSQHQGSFRWTSCTIDDLLRRATPKAIKSALDGVASTLGDIYTAILHNISGDMADVARSMLQFLVSAMRPLTLNELGEAASLVLTDDFGEDDRLIEPEAIVHSLHSLVHYDTGSQRIELAHSSVRTFLTTPDLSGAYFIDPIAANTAMSRACLYYLALPPFQHTCIDETALEARKRAWPFLEYSACFWTRHARAMVPSRCDSDEHYLAHFIKFAGSAGHFAAWYQCVYPQGGPEIWATPPLYMCAREGLVAPLRVLLARCGRNELEQRGGARGSTALHVAATYGEVEAVRLLLAAGANPNERNVMGESGIQWAAFWKHDETVQVLLEAGASPDLLLTYETNAELHDSMVLHAQALSPRHTGKEEGSKHTHGS